MPENNQSKSFTQSAISALAKNAVSLAVFAPTCTALAFPGSQFVLYLQTAAGNKSFQAYCQQHYQAKGLTRNFPRYSYLTENVRPSIMSGAPNRAGLLLPFLVASDLYKGTPYELVAYAAAIPISGLLQSIPTYRPRSLAISHITNPVDKAKFMRSLLSFEAYKHLFSPWLAVKVWAGAVTFGLYDQGAKPYVQKLFPQWKKINQDLLSAATAIPLAQTLIVPFDSKVARLMSPYIRTLAGQQGIKMPAQIPLPELSYMAHARIWFFRVATVKAIETGLVIVGVNLLKDLTSGKDDIYSITKAIQQGIQSKTSTPSLGSSRSFWQAKQPQQLPPPSNEHSNTRQNKGPGGT